MTGIETGVAVRVISQPLLDIYNLGKEQFEKELAKLKSASVIRRLAQKVASAQKVKTFWQRDKEVLLSSFYYPSKVIMDKRKKKSVQSLKEFPLGTNYVIQGTVGQGKSIFLRYLCVQELKETGSGRIPIFLELRTLTAKGLLPAVYSAMEALGFEVNDSLFEFFAESGKLVLLLDAFDELDDSLVKNTLSEIDHISERYPSLQVFITARPDSEIQNSRHFRVVFLAPLTHEDHLPFFRRLGLNKDDVERLAAAIAGSSSQVSSLLTTPLMLTLFVIVYKSEQSIPRELPDFFDCLFQTLFTRHDKSKPGLIRPQKSQLGERRLQQLFQAFCFCSLQLRQKTILSNEEFNLALDRAIKVSGIQCTAEGFRHDIVKVACLLMEEGFDLHFIHKSVLEFYAASFVRGLTEDQAEKFYGEILKKREVQGQWSQVLRFLDNIDYYRYSKFYAIPGLQNALANYGLYAPLFEIDESIAIIHKISPRMEIGLGRFNVKGDYQVRMVTNVPLNAFIPELADVPGVLLNESKVKFASIEEIIEAFPNAKEDEDEEDIVLVPWQDFATPSLTKKVMQAGAQALHSAVSRLQAYESAVDIEDKKLDLFQL